MLKEAFVLFVVSFGIVSSAKIQCRHDSDCTSDECCYYHEGPIVLSKKRQALLPFSGIFQGGWCEQYKTEGQSCGVIDKMNGHCECKPGLTCTPVHKRYQDYGECMKFVSNNKQ